MATISLIDGFGLVIDVKPDPTSVFAKYVQKLISAEATLTDHQDISQVTVDSYPFKTQTIGLSFKQAVPLGTSGVELEVKPQVSGTIALHDGDNLLDRTLFGRDDTKPLLEQKYLSAELEACLSGALLDRAGDLQFGFAAGNDIRIAYSEPVKAADKLVPAIQTAFQHFMIPGDLEDLAQMTAGSVASVEGTGTLELSAGVDVLTVTNPLATVATGTAFLKSLGLNQGGSVAVDVSVTFTGGYKLQVTKLDSKRVLLAYCRKNGQELDVSFTSEVGLSAGISSFDLFKLMLQAVSPGEVSLAELKNAGLSSDKIGAIATAIKAGIQRNLQVAFEAELDLSSEHAAAFLYEVDLAALDAGGRLAVHNGIDGKLSGLEKLPSGVKRLRSVVSAARETTRTLKLNLLGILNRGSVSDMLQECDFVVDPDTGDITITDTTTASQVEYNVNHLAKDGNKLRRLLADGFLATCVYHASQTGFRPNITSECWAVELLSSANLSNIRDYLNVAVVMNLITLDAAAERIAALRSVGHFGRTLFYADSSYAPPIFQSLFFDADGKVWPQSHYEGLGRKAMAATLPSGLSAELNNARLLPLTNLGIWQQMAGGQGTFAALFRQYGFNDLELADIRGDWGIIRWWASAMHDLGESLAAMLTFLNGPDNSGDPHNNTFIKLRGELNDKLKSVIQQTHDRFSQPWGFVVMDMASGQKSKTGLSITSPRVTVSCSRGDLAGVAMAARGQP